VTTISILRVERVLNIESLTSHKIGNGQQLTCCHTKMKSEVFTMPSDISISDTTSACMDDERDEVLEVKKLTSKDTFRVQTWRFVVTGVLALTAVAVTLTTYRFLVKEEKKNFVAAVSNFVLV
jgi:hypothetical protein